MVIPDQFVDRTLQRKARRFFGRGLVAHVAFAHPFCADLSAVLAQACARGGATASRGRQPTSASRARSSPPAPSPSCTGRGAWTSSGMTNLQEAQLAREAEICYSTLAMVTDYDCWHPDHDTVTVDADHGEPGRRTPPPPGRAAGGGAARARRRRAAASARSALAHAAHHRRPSWCPRRSSGSWPRSSASTSSKARSHVHPRRRQRRVRHRRDAVRARREGARRQRVVLLRGRVLLRAREPGRRWWASDFGEKQLAAFARPAHRPRRASSAARARPSTGRASTPTTSTRRDTICTDLNVFEFFKPRIPDRLPALRARVPRQHRPRAAARGAGPGRAPAARGLRHHELLDLGQARGAASGPSPRVDILLINDAEARELSGEWNIVKAARAIRAMGPQTLVIKKGEHGVLMFSEERLLRRARLSRSRRSSTRPARATPSPAASSATWPARDPGGRRRPAPRRRDGQHARVVLRARPSASTAC